MAGPWFTVLRNGDDWQTLGDVWVSNGQADEKGRIEMRVELESNDAELSAF